MKVLAIIPARGGSKRIPKKNIKLFLNKPVIAYAIKLAISSNIFDEVMVSTDSEEIANVALKYGAKVPFIRSNKTSSDYATTFEVIDEVITQYSSLNVEFDRACCIYPCTPLLTVETLLSSYKKLIDEKLDCVFPVIEYSFPIQRSVVIENNRVKMNYPEFLKTRSQDLTPNYHDAGQFYFFEINKLLKFKNLYTDNTGVIILSELDAQDIDNFSDWKLAEFKYKFRK
jgi:pseudaminic acid cytidylyltransferase